MQRPFPYFDRERREPERFAEAIHIGCETSFTESPSDPINVVRLDFGAGTNWEIMTLAGIRSFRVIVSFTKLKPQELLEMRVSTTRLLIGQGGVADKTNVIAVIRNIRSLR